MIERIPKEQYMRALLHFRRECPRLAWGIDDRPEGDAYHIEGTGVYFCIAHISNGSFGINGAFCMSGWALARPDGRVAAKIVRLCTEMGAKQITLCAFDGAHRAWVAMGFRTVMVMPFELHMAPTNWRCEYGMPSVHYMKLEV